MDVYSKKIKGRWFLLEKDRKNIRELNDVAGLIWELIEVPVSVEIVLNRVVEEFEINLKTAKENVETFIENYVKEGFIKRVSY